MKDLALTLPGGETIQPPFSINAGPFGQNIIQVALNLLFILAVVLAIFFIIWSGIQWIISAGDKQKLQAAKSRLTFAIVGLVIVFLALLTVNLIGSLFNIKLIGP